MKRSIHIAALIVLLGWPLWVCPDGNRGVDRPLLASSLSGLVLDPSGGVIANAKIEVIDCPVVGRDYSTPHRTLATSNTDRQGEFSLDRRRFKSPYCLRVGASGFNWVEVQVKLSRSVGRLRLTLPIAA